MNGYLLDPHYFSVQKVFRGISGWCTSERGRRELNHVRPSKKDAEFF